MEFTLYYEGELKSNANPQEKHTIREQLHLQLKKIWDEDPLKALHKYLSPQTTPSDLQKYCFLKKVGNYDFIPLVQEKFKMYTEINITLLRAGELAHILHPGGDIDNRLKTLFDALQPPDYNQANSIHPEPSKSPCYCLLEDDKLITKVSVSVKKLLLDREEKLVNLIIDVKIGGRSSIYYMFPHFGK